MAYDKDQNEPALPVGGNSKRKSENFLPRFFRTNPNKKFLSSTLDQLIQPGQVEKINAFTGRKTAKAFVADDSYVGDVSANRENYQLEPAAVITDNLGNVNFYKDYNDYMNQLKNFGSIATNHSFINEQEYYAWDPHVDFDKLTNFREYYWLASGPQTVTVQGDEREIQSTYTVTLADNADNVSYVFSPDGLTQNPTLKLFRGVTYTFIVDTPNFPLTFRTKRTLDDEFLLDRDSTDGGVSSQSVEQGEITLTLTDESPDVLYYVADNDIELAGTIKIADKSESTFIDVDAEIVGKKQYTTAGGFDLSNGMKINFAGEVLPSKYASGDWYVEGVGDKIQLISEADLEVPTAFTDDIPVEFDAQGFDRLPFSRAIGYPIEKDYIVINRSAQDGNLWSRYNRWFHKSVIEKAAEINNQPVEIDQSLRATRPIIEFEEGIKLYNFGTKAKTAVDLIDTFTKDAFSIIEGSIGYNVDGVDLSEGMRVIFTADNDIRVQNKVFVVKFINFAGGQSTNRQITLQEADDTDPLSNETVLVTQGEINRGKLFFYNGETWAAAQDKTKVNQAPLFDIFDKDGISYSDTSVYPATNFSGNKLFSYKEGTGTNDSELGFPLTYRSIENVGDIVFSFDLLNGSNEYTSDNQIITIKTDIGFLQKYTDLNSYSSITAWKKATTKSEQPIIRQYVADGESSDFRIDVYDNSASLTDLWVRVYKNNELQFEDKDFDISVDTEYATVSFDIKPKVNDVIIIKTKSRTTKNENGYYEIASQLEKNPLNNDLNLFTLGEVNDHVSTIVESLDDFEGIFPGSSNLRDQKNLAGLGKKILKHSSPLNLSLYHLLDKDANIINALRYSRQEYAKFKRVFIQTAETLGFEGPVKTHVDKIMEKINADKTIQMPFYFSDMVPTGAVIRTEHEIIDSDEKYFALNEVFELNTLSRKAVGVYKNGVQATHGKDYTFNNEGFVVFDGEKVVGDKIEIYEYETTNGSFVPPTPSKLGLYPAYRPMIYTDTNYNTAVDVIQGHDGSIIKAYGDFRDNLLLELEKRIFNNIKVNYDTNLFDIHDFIGGENRQTNIKKSELDAGMLPDFIQWTNLVDEEYTDNTVYTRSNGLTFNYYVQADSNNTALPGFWREVYKWAYDTDRPNLTPWEMLGFSTEPSWWTTQYGPAPYTKNNFVMWNDIEKGIIREPNKKYRIVSKYARPGLTNHIPVDDNGNIVDPVTSGYIKNFITNGIDANWVFGDGAPVEQSWRKSSEYPFSLLTSLIINQPSKVFSSAYDRTRQIRNTAGNIVYKETAKQIRLEDIIFPNTFKDDTQVYTSGLVNYVKEYLTSDVTKSYDDYIANIKSIKNQIGFKMAGFSDQSKFRLILDSRTPTNKGNVFIPDENYKIFLNKSTPVKTIAYSGVIIEKQSNGYIIRGYDTQTAAFKYHRAINLNTDPTIRVGGVSESFIDYEPTKQYIAGQNILFNGTYYRVKKSFIGGSEPTTEEVAKLPGLPLQGGRDAVLKKTFDTRTSLSLAYGTLLRTVQDVVDFLLGYQSYLVQQGFVFDDYEGNEKVVLDFEHSTREFVFWTTQNWDAGSVITLSPSALRLTFESEYSTVDDVFDDFYGYSIFKADGKKLFEDFTSLGRSDQNKFSITPTDTEDGIFNIRLPLVQKEHVCLIDNTTVFGDVIYDLEPGYRQERIKILGYKTEGWDGSLNVPGFLFDDVKITEWEPYIDYQIGSVVQYKEFYYTANKKIPGVQTFNDKDWVRLDEKPESGLISNFEYRTNQFADFYDLDSDNFDVEQQKLAQHLIGYQKRQYLENIINDSVSQYKFYQGYILDKGSKNSLTKLFDALASDDKDSLEFYEEWAIKDGQYGASEGFDEVEYLLDEKQFRLKPQPIELVNQIDPQSKDLVYRILPFETYLKPDGYDHKPFPTKYIEKSYTGNSGYVNLDDIDHRLGFYDDITTLNFSDVDSGHYVWIGNDKLSWNVYKHIDSKVNFNRIEQGDNEFTIYCKTTPDFAVGDVIGLHSVYTYEIGEGTAEDSTTTTITADVPIEGFFKIKKVTNEQVVLISDTPPSDVDKCYGSITKFVSVRASNIDVANTTLQKTLENNDYIWLDDYGNSQWAVLNNTSRFNNFQQINNPSNSGSESFGNSVSIDDRNTVMAIGSPDRDDGAVDIYYRPAESTQWKRTQSLEPFAYGNANEKFGSSVSLTNDGKFLIVGSPEASNIKTKYKQDYSESTTYEKNEIVKYQDNLWKAKLAIQPRATNVQFNSFYSTTQAIYDLGAQNNSNLDVVVMTTGAFPIRDITMDHILVRAEKTIFDGTGENDQIKLHWNTKSYTYQGEGSIIEKQPFAGSYENIDSDFINGLHTVQKKIDSVLYVPSAANIPNVGDVLATGAAEGTVVFVYAKGTEISIYLADQSGTFPASGSAFNQDSDFVGEYTLVLPDDSVDTSDTYGGWFYIETDSNFYISTTTDNTVTDTEDQGRGLVYIDTITDSADNALLYSNSLEQDTDTINSQNTWGSQLGKISNQGAPGAYNNSNEILSDKWYLRTAKSVSDNLTIGDTINVYVNQLQRFDDNYFVDITDIGLTTAITNQSHQIVDIWDGYINYDYTKFSAGGDPFEPIVGQTVRDRNTGATGVVAEYIRDSLNATVYVKSVSGTWSRGADFGENAEIEFLPAPGATDPIYTVTRTIGQIQHVSLGYAPEDIGKLLVFTHTSDLAVTDVKDLRYVEYYVYQSRTVLGVPRAANIPSGSNNDWEQVFVIPADASGVASGYNKEGMYTVFERTSPGQYVSLGGFITPQNTNNYKLGAKILSSVDNSLYRAFIYSDSNPGRVHFIKKGVENNNTYNWEYARNKSFKGSFSSSIAYQTNDIVFLEGSIVGEGNLYQAKTNVAAGSFNLVDWTLIDGFVDYVGYIPNDQGISVIDDSTFDSTVLDQTAISTFASAYDISKNGRVLIASATYTDINKPNVLVVYREKDGLFYRSQELQAPNKTTGWGESVAISADGMTIAVGAPYDDDVKLNQGIVYIYSQVNGTFTKVQELNSPNNEKAENFGAKIDFDGNTLHIVSRNADSIRVTSYDENTTTFDNGFTTFKSVNEDSGIIYVYERLLGEMLYGQAINADASIDYFGEAIAAKNNHLYVSMPNLSVGSGVGQVIDYRKNLDTNLWNIHRQSKDPVDVSKIKRAILYNTKTNSLLTYLDYIDPIQGKIAGPAEENISYKTNYDPAVYDQSTTPSVVVDEFATWGSEHVGQVWWDLSTVKFLNPYQGNVIYSANNWNSVFPGNSVDIYEWVESDIVPSEYRELAQTNDGLSQGYSGIPKYLDATYVTKRTYDSIAQAFTTKYYFWVKGKVSIPNIEGRTLNTTDIEKFIADPASMGHKFAALISNNSFVLYNCDSFIEEKDVAISLQYWTIPNQTQNIHNQYQLVSDGLETSMPKLDIQRKWFDSLIGYDKNGAPVPDPNLSPKQKYGTLSKPRQSWFVNRQEALKQFIERTNNVLKQNLIVDDKSLTTLSQKDPEPSAVTNLFDQKVDTLEDLELVGVAKAKRAVLTPVVVDGKITRVVISDPGRGYKKPPTVTINGIGSGAVITTKIDLLGKVNEVTVVEQGENYNDQTTVTVRNFSVLVSNDSTIQGKWGLYERNPDTRIWTRINSQDYDVTSYWSYIDWYAQDYNSLTEIDYLIDRSNELSALDDIIGDIVKIKNVGTGGWLLLEKIADEDTIDYSVNYKTIGRENGTIQFSNTLYDVRESSIGYDNISFDIRFFDSEPVFETRVILETIRDNLLIDELAYEYNQLFFASIRYVLSEQTYVDWLFKTSFIKAKHNAGYLREDITFNNDNLPSYEDYVQEVKPFGTKIREYLSAYEALENTQSVVTDFDLPPKYNNFYKQILPEFIKINNNTLIGEDADITTYPNKHWLDNHTHGVEKIIVANKGSGILSTPKVTLTGGGGSGATAQAYVGNGKITSIQVINPGTGYTSVPTINFDLNLDEGGTAPTASVILAANPVRGILTAVKFDRITGSYTVTKLEEEETFTASGSTFDFKLTWPLDFIKTHITVTVDNIEALSSEYSYTNELDTTKGYDRYFGKITFVNAPSKNAVVKIKYQKSVDLLHAADRINLFYDPAEGQYGKVLNQLMEGVDYGGVEVKSFGFDISEGFDSDGYTEGTFDTYDTTFEDEVFEFDASTTSIELTKPLEDGVTYNVYIKRSDQDQAIRIDDPLYDGSTVTENPNATMRTIVGDGTTSVIFLDNLPGENDGIVIKVKEGDTLVIRKNTSDGTFLPDPVTYDTLIEGGNLNYSTARGIDAAEINIDGDGFVTPTTSKGPEEQVPGQVLDTVDIQIYERPSSGASQIISRNYIADGSETTFDLGSKPVIGTQVFVKLGYNIQDSDEYTISYVDNTVTFNTAPAAGTRVHLATLDVAGEKILDIDELQGDGSTVNFLTNVRWTDDISYYATIDGVKKESSVIESDESYEYPGNVVIQFGTAPADGETVRFAIFEGSTQNYSEVTIDNFTGDGTTLSYTLNKTPYTKEPSAWSVLVKKNNKILNAGYSQKFATTEAKLEYKLDLWQIPSGTIRTGEIEVYLNGKKLREQFDYSFIGSDFFDSTVSSQNQRANIIRLVDGKSVDNGTLEVYVLTDGEYAFGYLDSNGDWVSTPGTLYLDDAPENGDTLTVYQFSNNSIQGISRTGLDVVEKITLTVGSDEWYDYRHLANGLVELQNIAIDSEYVWVAVNGDLLTPNVNYYVTENKRYVKILTELSENDVIDIFEFAGTKKVDKFGWRQFKDMLNRNHYKRIDGTEDIVLVKDLLITDNKIEVDDASSLPAPPADASTPGVVFIEGERIEYFVKQGNELQQIRRATLGTGAKDVYVAGTEIYNQSANSNMPYVDETKTTIFTADGTTNTYELDFDTSDNNIYPLKTFQDNTDLFEVFVAGKRLRKNSIEQYRAEYTDDDGNIISSPAQDSPEGDVTLEPEFSVTGTTLTVAETPKENSKVIVIRKQGKRWSDPGTQLSKADNDIARFLRIKRVDLPR